MFLVFGGGEILLTRCFCLVSSFAAFSAAEALDTANHVGDDIPAVRSKRGSLPTPRLLGRRS